MTIQEFLWEFASIMLISFLIGNIVFDILIVLHEKKVEWIERERKSLEALINDHDHLVKKGEELKARAHRFWDSDDLSGFRLQLEKEESNWTKSTRSVVDEAKKCVTNYNETKGGLFSFLWNACSRFQFIRIPTIIKNSIEVLYQVHTVQSEMINHSKSKESNAKDIYKSMEGLRSMIRSLSDQYTSEEASKSEGAQNPKQKQPTTSMDELMKMGEDLFSGLGERLFIQLLLPLNAMVKELSQLQFETETENHWKTEAEKLIEEAELCCSKFLWWASKASFLKSRIPGITQYLLTNKLNGIVTRFDDLLEMKKKYDFSFVDVAPVKSTFPSNKNDNAIEPAIKKIKRKLSKMEKQVPELDSVLHNFQTAEDQETAWKNDGLKQLKSIAKELDSIPENYLNEAELDHHKIRNAIDLLCKMINNCSIERKVPTTVGLKNDIQDLVSKLTTGSDSPSNSVLSIIGMKGVGKTTLAKAIYYNKAAVKHFPVRVWVTVTSGSADKSQVLLIKRDWTNNKTLNVTQLCDHLKEKPCLVVLDDLSDIVDFVELRGILSESGMENGSRIVLTTRFKDVALHPDISSTPHQIRLLTKEESWKLFEKVIGTEKSKLEHKETLALARKVVGRCGGLPLAISSIGFVVQAKGLTQKLLSWVLDRINQGHFKDHWLKAWEENKRRIATKTDCLYYFTHFPLGFEIPARRLVNLWVAEGFFEQNDQEKAKDIAEKCLEELRDCNMIQAVTLKSNGKIKTCQLPCTLTEVILQDNNRISRSQYSGSHLDRRFAFRFDDQSRDANSANVFSQKGVPLSVFFFDNREGSKPGEHVKKILSTGIASEQFRDVRVLDLEGIFRPRLPQTLCKLIHITYLSLRWTYLEEFPQFIGKMVNLKTLDLKHTCIRVLPSSIWKLKKLETLYLNQKYRSRLEGKLRRNYQENFHTLWGVFMYGDCPLLHDLHRLKNLQKLKLAFQLTTQDKETLAKNIVKLNQLHSLRLRSVNDIGRAKKLILHDMSKLENLSSLQLIGKIKGKLQMNQLPKNLTDLTLSESKLSDDPMPALQSLLKLRTLSFYAKSYRGRKMVCTRGSFPQLQVLRFWNLDKLQEWEVSEGTMPSLKEFEVRSCENLAVAIGLKHLEKTLLLIKLPGVQDTFRTDIEKTLPDVEILPPRQVFIAMHQSR